MQYESSSDERYWNKLNTFETEFHLETLKYEQTKSAEINEGECQLIVFPVSKRCRTSSWYNALGSQRNWKTQRNFYQLTGVEGTY